MKTGNESVSKGKYFIRKLRLTMTVLPVIGLAVAAVFFGKKFVLTDDRIKEIGEALQKDTQ